MASTSGGDPGGSNGRTLPAWLDGRNEFGAATTLLLTGKDGRNLPIEPFIIGKSLELWAGPIEHARSEKKGSRYVLRTRKPAQVEKLLKMTELVDGTEVSIVLHPTLNASRCVISAFDLLNKEEAEILEGTSSQGVTQVRRILRSNKERTSALILTFNRSVYPAEVKVGVLYFKTKPYYPNPMLCFGCYEYGHPRSGCVNPRRCYNCSDDHEERESCENAPFCRNCENNHRPSSRQCPIYKTEMDIIRTKIDLNISSDEARKRVAAGNGTYAQVAAQPRLDHVRMNSLTAKIAEKDKKIEKLEAELQRTSQEMLSKLDAIIAQNEQKEKDIKELMERLSERDEKIERIEAANKAMKQYIEDMATRTRTNSQSSEPTPQSNSNKKSKTKRSTPQNSNEQPQRSNMSPPPPKKQSNNNRSPILTRQTSNRLKGANAIPIDIDSPSDFDPPDPTDYGPHNQHQ